MWTVACGGDGQDAGAEAGAGDTTPVARETFPDSPDATRAIRDSVPATTAFRVRLNEELGMQSAEGDTFTVTLAEPLRGVGGATLPTGVEIGGTVTGVQQLEGANRPGILKVDLREVRLRGRPIPLYAVVVATSPGPAAPGEGGGRNQALADPLGEIVTSENQGLMRDTFAAASGTAIILATPQGEARLPANSELRLRLEAALEIPGS